MRVWLVFISMLIERYQRGNLAALGGFIFKERIVRCMILFLASYIH